MMLEHLQGAPGGSTFAVTEGPVSNLHSLVIAIGEYGPGWYYAETFLTSVEVASEHGHKPTSRTPLEIGAVINHYVSASDSLSVQELNMLRRAVAGSIVAPSVTHLERVQRDDPKWVAGDEVEFVVASFTSVRIADGQKAGVIAWKSSDKCIVVIDDPYRGLTIDYSKVKVMFSASAERETLITGRYRVLRVDKITEPGTRPEQGWPKIPMYTLQEIDA